MRHYVGLMGGIGSRFVLGLAATLAVFGTLAGTASAGTTIFASEDCCNYEPGPYIQDLGDLATFDNTLSTAPHDVRASQLGPDGAPLFSSAVISGGGTSTVRGTQYLKAGTYPFFCIIHGSSMSGDLTIDGSKGTVVPRPSTRVSFVKQKLRQVRKSGVRVKVTAVTASKPVRITATKGKTTIAVKSGLSLGAGKSRTLTLPLTKAGCKAISKGKTVQIKLKATVPFGKPSTASRKVR